MATDRLASLGDPPSRLRLELVRFRLEGIDTGWKVVTAHRVLPGDVEPKASRQGAKPAHRFTEIGNRRRRARRRARRVTLQ